MARNALMDLAEHTDRFKFLIRDHGPQFTASFDAVFHADDIRIVTTGIQAPVTNAIQDAGTARSAENYSTALSCGTSTTYATSWPSTSASTTSTGRTEHWAKPHRYAPCRTTSSTSTTSASPDTTGSAESSTNATMRPDQHGWTSRHLQPKTLDDAVEGRTERVRDHLRRTPVRRTKVEPFTT